MSLVTRFADMLLVRGLDACWGWSGSKNPKGYGKINKRGRA